MIFCSQASFGQESWVFFFGGRTGSSTFCCDLGYPPASFASWSGSGANSIPPQTQQGVEELGPDWSPMQNRLSARQGCSAPDPGMLRPVGKSPFEGRPWVEGSLFTLQVLLPTVCPGTAGKGSQLCASGLR